MSRKVLTSPYIVWGAAFIILPLFMVIYYGCTGSDGSFTLSNITAMADPVHYKAFWNSVWIAMASTMICLVISYPLAYILSKGKHRGSGVVIMLFVLPMWINFLLRVLALQVILSKNRNFKCNPWLFRTTFTEVNVYERSRTDWNGL